MRSRISDHIRGNLVGYLALVIALSGTAYAANKVGSKDIKTGAVKSKQIGDDKVKSKDIKDDGGVKSQDVKDGSLTGEDIDESSLGLLASDRILYGRAPSGADEALLFEWPGTGVEVRTHDTDAGDAIFEVRIVNTNPPGGSSFRITDGSSAIGLTPGSSKKEGGLIGASVLLTENKGSLGRMMRLHCFANVIAGGDDGFMQCMGVTAGAA